MRKNNLATNLQYCNLRITIRFLMSGLLPEYKGSMLRGAFGNAFKKAICMHPGSFCDKCVSRNKCGYIFVFETPVSEKALAITGSNNAPHPFVITPIDNRRRKVDEEDRLAIDLTLFGEKTIVLLPYIIRAFETASVKGYTSKEVKSVVESVVSISDGKRLYTAETGFSLMPTPERFSLKEKFPKNNNIVMTFLTPVRIQKNGKIQSHFDFYTVMSTLLRRYSSILFYHCGLELPIDAKAYLKNTEKAKVVDCSLRRYEWTRMSNRQGSVIDMDGMVGSITFSGVSSEYMELLKLGEIMHIGKGTAFGLGSYRVDINEQEDK